MGLAPLEVLYRAGFSCGSNAPPFLVGSETEVRRMRYSKWRAGNGDDILDQVHFAQLKDRTEEKKAWGEVCGGEE